MKAFIRTGWTGFALDFDEKAPVPRFDVYKENAHDVFVHVHAAAMNPIDYKLPKLPAGKIVGIDFCGTVDEVGNKVSHFKEGDVVIGAAKIPDAGSIAEYTIAKADHIAHLPQGWTVEEGAAVPTAYDTGLLGFERAGIIDKYNANPDEPPVDSVLIIGASGGCGTAALHLAKGMGIPRIIAISSKKNEEFCKRNGATEVVPYDDKETMDAFLENNKEKIGLIYDAATSGGGGEKYSSNQRILDLLSAKKGDKEAKPTYPVLNGGPSHWLRNFTLGSPSSDPRISLIDTEHSTERLGTAIELLDKAKMRPVLDSTCDFNLKSLDNGYKKLKSRRTTGKIVVNVSDIHFSK